MAATKSNHYTRLVKAAGAVCRGTGLKSTLTAAAKKYVETAVKKGKPEAEAKRIASKHVSTTCSVKIGKAKRKATRKSTTRKRA